MTKLTTEELKEIIDGAPDDATHYSDTREYFKKNLAWLVDDDHCGSWVQVGLFTPNDIRLLSDLREILGLRERVKRLEREKHKATLEATHYCLELIESLSNAKDMRNRIMEHYSELKDNNND